MLRTVHSTSCPVVKSVAVVFHARSINYIVSLTCTVSRKREVGNNGWPYFPTRKPQSLNPEVCALIFSARSHRSRLLTPETQHPNQP